MIFIFSMLCVFMVSGGYFYLRRNIGAAESPVSDVPYTFSEPQNSGILVECSGRKVYLYLDFSNERVTVIFPKILEEDERELYGYSIDYTLMITEPALAGLIDEVGGVDLEWEGEELRYTGVQVTDYLSRRPTPQSAEKTLIAALCERISEIGISKEYLVKMVQNGETDLTVPDCYFWSEWLPSLCQNVNFVDEIF